ENLSGVDAVVEVGDLDEAVPAQLRGSVRLITANVPYVPSDRVDYLPAEARDHEPRTALDGGDDGLEVLRRIAPRAPGWLPPGGWFLTECALDQGGPAAAVLRWSGLSAVVHQDNELDVAVVAGQIASTVNT